MVLHVVVKFICLNAINVGQFFVYCIQTRCLICVQNDRLQRCSANLGSLPVRYLTNEIGYQDCGMCYKNTQMEI